MSCLADMETVLEKSRSRNVQHVISTADASGNFLFTNAPAGPQALLIDGPTGLPRQPAGADDDSSRRGERAAVSRVSP